MVERANARSRRRGQSAKEKTEELKYTGERQLRGNSLV